MGENKHSFLGEFVEPSSIPELLHTAEMEYFQLMGFVHADDTRAAVDRRLDAQQHFHDKPDTPYPIGNDIDCALYISRKTGLSMLLCLYHLYFWSRNGTNRVWDFDEELFSYDRAKANRLITNSGFDRAITSILFLAIVHPEPRARALNAHLAGELIAAENDRRVTEAHRIYEAINERYSRDWNLEEKLQQLRRKQ